MYIATVHNAKETTVLSKKNWEAKKQDQKQKQADCTAVVSHSKLCKISSQPSLYTQPLVITHTLVMKNDFS